MRVGLYARYSSDNQREASIADQLRLCREHAELYDWTIVEEYSDHATSGASMLRPGIQALMSDATRSRFDLILTESLDRLSRDQEDIAGLYKRMRFAGVKIVTLSEGEVGELHIGLKGTMGALYLRDLADKTRRGLRGRIEEGKSGGGLSYGYTVTRPTGPDGLPATGERIINEEEATVVRRIFVDYADGKSPKRIARELDHDGIAAPSGGAWQYDQRQREARQWHPQQRAVHREDGVESAALPERPRDRQARLADESVIRMDHQGGAASAHPR